MASILLRRTARIGALALLALPLAGCGIRDIDKGSAIRADEALYASLAKPSDARVERRVAYPDLERQDTGIMQRTLGWSLDYDIATKRPIDAVYHRVRMHLPAGWRCTDQYYDQGGAPSKTGGGWCWSPDKQRAVAVEGSMKSDTIRIAVDAGDLEQTGLNMPERSYAASRP
jgi:hypothetical protein